jgi:hypothetical protein
MSDAFIYSPPMNEELAIACVLYVAQKENLAPEEVLWGIVPIANRQTVDDGIRHEEENHRQSGGSYTEDHSVSRCAG